MSRWFDAAFNAAMGLKFTTDEVAIIEAQSRAEIAKIEAQSEADKSEAMQASILRGIEEGNRAWHNACFRSVSKASSHDSSSSYGDGGEPGNHISNSWP